MKVHPEGRKCCHLALGQSWSGSYLWETTHTAGSLSASYGLCLDVPSEIACAHTWGFWMVTFGLLGM